MARTPRSRTRPPQPKERPISLAASAGPSLVPRPPLPSPAPTSEKGDIVGFWVFTALVLLGLVAAARAFIVM